MDDELEHLENAKKINQSKQEKLVQVLTSITSRRQEKFNKELFLADLQDQVVKKRQEVKEKEKEHSQLKREYKETCAHIVDALRQVVVLIFICNASVLNTYSLHCAVK